MDGVLIAAVWLVLGILVGGYLCDKWHKRQENREVMRTLADVKDVLDDLEDSATKEDKEAT